MDFKAFEEDIRAAVIQERLVASLSAFFGGLALLLAAIGLYGVMSYSVARRRNEIGIRMALGAAPAKVMGLVLTNVAIVTVVGLVVGSRRRVGHGPLRQHDAVRAGGERLDDDGHRGRRARRRCHAGGLPACSACARVDPDGRRCEDCKTGASAAAQLRRASSSISMAASSAMAPPRSSAPFTTGRFR